MKKKKKELGTLESLYKQYKVVISNDKTFEERLSFKASKLSVFLTTLLYTAGLISATTALIFFTPLKEYAPGYSSLDLLKKVTELTFKTDSMETEFVIKDQYISSIKKVLTGELDTVTFSRDSILNERNLEDLLTNLTPSKEDSLLRKYIEEEDRFNLTSSQLLIENKMLFLPVEGTITQSFNAKENHLAIDIAVDTGTPIKAISGGRVLFAEWTVETGYVIIIDHGDMLITTYKHNSSLLKKQNEIVNAGEVIALSGNHGTLTTGPHLHFELWKNGSPIDPLQLFNFK